MASGDPVVQFLDINPPATLAAQVSTRSGGSTPAERIRVFHFDAATTEYLDYKAVLVGYDGGGLTFRIKWQAATATSGTCTWEIAIRRLADDAEDADTSHTYDYNSVTPSAASPNGEVYYDNITFTNGADMDSWADGEIAWVRIRRNISDTMSGDALLVALTGTET